MSDSRIRKYVKTRLPRQKRTISIFGAEGYIDGRVVKDQSNKLYRCWYCGFICNTDRDKLGDGEGFYITDDVDKPIVQNKGAGANEFPMSNLQWDVQISIDEPVTPHLAKLDSQGQPIEVMHNNTSMVTSGCPLCGCKSYK